MKLVLTESPGRSTRKARDFESEIVQLRAQGYTLEAIRRALANAGVHVSISTVRREATRPAVRHPVRAMREAATTSVPAPSRPSTATLASAETATPPVVAEVLSPKEYAEAFMKSQITNPLLRAKVKQ